MSERTLSQVGTPADLRDRSDEAGDDVTIYRDRPSDDGKKGQKANRADAPAAMSSLGNFAGEDLADGADDKAK